MHGVVWPLPARSGTARNSPAATDEPIVGSAASLIEVLQRIATDGFANLHFSFARRVRTLARQIEPDTAVPLRRTRRWWQASGPSREGRAAALHLEHDAGDRR